MRRVMQLEQYLESGNGGLAIGGLKLLVNLRHQEHMPHRIEHLAAPELVGVTRGHPDHGEEGRDKATTHQSVMSRGLVQVVGASDRHDGLQVRWPLDCGLHLCASE